jgi:phosphate transport system substrate-binding protein
MPWMRCLTVVGGMACALVLSTALLLATSQGCSSARSDGDTIKVTGSDTIVGLAQAWAAAFGQEHPNISMQVKGGGSGVGIAALCSGKIKIATASRPMTEKEIELAKKNTGKEPQQFVVGRDALAIYVHQQNPIETISLGELAEIYGEGGKVNAWKDLNVDNAACGGGEIVPVSRQNSSGTYAYFKEVVLGAKREYRQGITSQSGSSDVVGLVSNTPCAIGYSGMGYKDDKVKVLKVAQEKGQPGVEPNTASALDGSYPISRPLYLYTLGEPAGAVQEFIQWALGDEGQKIVEKQGYVPVGQAAATH